MKKIHEKLLKFFESKVLVKVLYVLGAFIILALVFSAGMSTGFHKASFGRAWGEHYGKNFGMRPEFPGPGFGRDNFPNAHGTVGKILKIELPNLIVEDRGGTEKIVLTDLNTEVQKMRQAVKVSDLKTDDFIVVIGTPNDSGQIVAKFIRLMPDPEFMSKGMMWNQIKTDEKPIQ